MAYTVPVAEDLPTLVEDAKEGRETVDNTLEKTFAGLVCTMLYIGSTTRPDIMYGVGMLTRCLTCPTKPLMRAAERIMYYLENTKHLGLRYTADTAQQAQHGSYACTKVTGMSDANHAVKRSTSGRCFDAGAKAVVSYGMKKQASVAISTAEAEINAASEAASEAVHLAGIHADAGFPLNGPVVLYLDNKAAIDMAHDPTHLTKAKHIKRRSFFVRELVEDKQVEVQYVRSEDNTADIFTKPLKKRSFLKHRARLLNM